jgi:hypothetical protein
MDLPDSNALAGLAALVNSLLMAPTVVALRKISKRHDDKLEEHDTRLAKIETPKRRRRK